MGKFITKVRGFIREYVPEGASSLEDFEVLVDIVDGLRDEMENMLSKPDRKYADEIHETAYNFAVAQVDEYRSAQRLLGSIAGAFTAVIREHLDEVSKIGSVSLREGAGEKSTGTSLFYGKSKTERQDLIEQARDVSRAKKKIIHGDVKPLRILLTRCKSLIKSLSLKGKAQFPSPARGSGWAYDQPISDSSDPQKDVLTGEAHGVCKLFADGVSKTFMAKLIQLETGKTRAKERSERKKATAEQRALASERLEGLMDIRKKRKSQSSESMVKAHGG